jgi:hypothetical protein
MFAEAIPGTILQLYAALRLFLVGGDVSKRAVLSIALSALTTGYTSSMLSYDYDVDPIKRKETPSFYGFVPDDGGARLILLVCMTLNSASLLLIRGFCAALLMLIEKRFFAWYLLGDMGIYLVQKIARGDFHYWVPIDGYWEVIVSLVLRVLVKSITDFTGVVQFRHPGELGGAYWTLNMVAALIFSCVVVEVFIKFLGSDEEFGDFFVSEEEKAAVSGVVLREEVIRSLVWGMSALWAFSFVVFLKLMKREYIGSFFSLKLGKEVTMDYFFEDDDASKAVVFTSNRKQWRAIEGDVKSWVQDGWVVWEEEHPEWFTDVFKSRIPAAWLSPEELRKQELAGGGNRRRSSLFGGMADAAVAMTKRKNIATIIPVSAATVDVDGGEGATFERLTAANDVDSPAEEQQVDVLEDEEDK